MKDKGHISNIKDLLLSIGYQENSMQDILCELDILLREMDFEKIKEATDAARETGDTDGLINSLKNLMYLLELRGYYRPDAPTRLIRLLVNGLNLAQEDIFAILDRAAIPEKEKLKEQEFLASCAAITQLGYILSSRLASGVKTASSGPHVFLVIDGFSPGSIIFLDYSIDSIREIEVNRYERKEDYYYLKNSGGLDEETTKLFTEYYSFFQLTSGTGLSHNIHNNLGLAYDRIGRYEEALEELREALRLNPGYIEVHNNLAVTLDKMGKHDEAFGEIQEVLSLNPGYVEAHSNLGNMYAGSGRYEEAIGELCEALRLNPGYAVAHNNLGYVYAVQKRYPEAIGEFQEALRLDADYAQARNNLGNTYSDSKRYEDAIKEFQETLRIDPEFPEAYLGIGLAYYNLGSLDRAAQAFARAAYLDRELLEFVPEKLSLKVRQGISRLSD
ncbi:Photosystem I assembly protein Ycf3 [uncultured archaeon]|nr:Photosystem I assembly protein Ycf3 [uncultured archaeon]